MTREEVKRRLLDIERCTYIHTSEDARDFEALEIAIQILERGQGMKAVSDTLTVTFGSSLKDEAGLCVSRVVNGKVVVLKMELGEQADILYHLLTEQTAKAAVKAEREDKK